MRTVRPWPQTQNFVKASFKHLQGQRAKETRSDQPCSETFPEVPVLSSELCLFSFTRQRSPSCLGCAKPIYPPHCCIHTRYVRHKPRQLFLLLVSYLLLMPWKCFLELSPAVLSRTGCSGREVFHPCHALGLAEPGRLT